MPEKLCPFGQAKSCIKDDCALYVHNDDEEGCSFPTIIHLLRGIEENTRPS